MEYQVGSVADAISGGSDASASKSRIVFVPETHKPSKRTNVETLNSSSLQLSTPGKRKKVKNGDEDNIDEPSFLKARGGMAPKYTSRELQRKNHALKKKKIAETKSKLLLKRGPGHVTEGEDDKDNRTVFVKNLPKTITPKQLKQMYKKFGEVESVRLRCAVPESPGVRKREAVIKKKFHEKRSNICAFVCFKTSESAKNAVKTDELEIDGHHIFNREIGNNKKKFSKENAIFVGNLPWDVEEDDLHGIFKICGKIVDVTIIRDKNTGMSCGVAYVNFENSDSVELALDLGVVEVKGRQVRVSRSQPKKGNKSMKQGQIKKRPIRKETSKIGKRQKMRKNHKKVTQKEVSSTVDENGHDSLPRSSMKVPKTNADFQGCTSEKIKKKKKISKAALKKKAVASILLSERKM